jgi:hypothetical protein
MKRPTWPAFRIFLILTQFSSSKGPWSQFHDWCQVPEERHWRPSFFNLLIRLMDHFNDIKGGVLGSIPVLWGAHKILSIPYKLLVSLKEEALKTITVPCGPVIKWTDTVVLRDSWRGGSSIFVLTRFKFVGTGPDKDNSRSGKSYVTSTKIWDGCDNAESACGN